MGLEIEKLRLDPLDLQPLFAEFLAQHSGIVLVQGLVDLGVETAAGTIETNERVDAALVERHEGVLERPVPNEVHGHALPDANGWTLIVVVQHLGRNRQRFVGPQPKARLQEALDQAKA